MTNSGYIKRLPIEEFEAQSRGGKVRTHTYNEFLVFLLDSNSCILEISYYYFIFIFSIFKMFTSNDFSYHVANYLLIYNLYSLLTMCQIYLPAFLNSAVSFLIDLPIYCNFTIYPFISIPFFLFLFLFLFSISSSTSFLPLFLTFHFLL